MLQAGLNTLPVSGGDIEPRRRHGIAKTERVVWHLSFDGTRHVAGTTGDHPFLEEPIEEGLVEVPFGPERGKRRSEGVVLSQWFEPPAASRGLSRCRA